MYRSPWPPAFIAAACRMSVTRSISYFRPSSHVISRGSIMPSSRKSALTATYTFDGLAVGIVCPIRHLHITKEIASCGDRRFYQFIALPFHHTKFKIKQFHRNFQCRCRRKECVVSIQCIKHLFIVQQVLRRKQVSFLFKTRGFIEHTNIVEGMDSTSRMKLGVT